MADKNNNKLLAELYSLRAGMSAISMEKDILKAEEDRLKSLKYKIEDNTADIMNYDSIVSASRKSLKSARKEYESAKRKYDKKGYSAFLWKIITVLGALLAVFLYISGTKADNALLFNVGAIAAGAFTLYAFVLASVKSIKVRPLKKQMKRAKELMRDSIVWIDEGSRGMRSTEEENRILSGKRNEFENSQPDSVKMSVAIAEALDAALKETYTELIRPSYWGKLDYIIDNIKSGKSKNINEACISVDSEITRGRMSASNTAAHAAVKRSFSLDYDLLSDSINSELKRLHKKIEEKNSMWIAKLRTDKHFSHKNAKNLEDVFGKRSEQSSLKKSLIERIDKDSMSLNADVDYITSYTYSASKK